MAGKNQREREIRGPNIPFKDMPLMTSFPPTGLQPPKVLLPPKNAVDQQPRLHSQGHWGDTIKPEQHPTPSKFI